MGVETGSCVIPGFASLMRFICGRWNSRSEPGSMFPPMFVPKFLSAFLSAIPNFLSTFLMIFMRVSLRASLTVFLSLALVIFNAAGALAQDQDTDTTGPVGMFEIPASHDGSTPFSVTIVFDEEPKQVGKRIQGLLVNIPPHDPPYRTVTHGPEFSNREKDPNDRRRYSFTATPQAPVDLRFRVSRGFTDSAGNEGLPINSLVIPYIATGNTLPQANAGPDQRVDSGASVTLNGSGSSDGNGTFTYSWVRTGGTGQAVILDDATAAMPVFTAETLVPGAASVDYVFGLTVTDDDDATDTDTVTITVVSGNVIPIADAGDDQTVDSGAMVTLDSSRSMDSDGTIASREWTRVRGTSGESVTLNDATAASPTFTADSVAAGTADVTHVFELVVTDDDGAESVADTVMITIVAPFSLTVAEAGTDQDMVPSGMRVFLDGRGSVTDRRRTIVSYVWERTGGTGELIPLGNTKAEQLIFFAETLAPGAPDVTYVLDLTVTDSAGYTDTDTVVITVISGFADPVADAGPDVEVGSGTLVTLDGRGSTVDRRRTIASRAWQRTGGTGNAVIWSDASVEQPTFTAQSLTEGAADVTHEFTLTVTDSEGETDTDTVIVTVTAGNATPVADAGENRTVISETMVELDGSGSTDSGGMVASYAWTRTGGTADIDVELENEDTAKPTFEADALQPGAADVIHIFSLVVTDDDNVESVADTVTITVTPPMTAPTADAGADQLVDSGERVILDGSGSYDIDGKIASRSWQRTGGTGGSVTLSSASAARPVFTADRLASGATDVTHVFTLTVTDDEGMTDTDTVTITVTAEERIPPTGKFEHPQTHDGKTGFTVALVFDKEVVFDYKNLVTRLSGITGTGIPTVVEVDPDTGEEKEVDVLGFDYNYKEHGPSISNFHQDQTDNLRYTFNVTPNKSLDVVPVAIGLQLRGRHYEDLDGNRGAFTIRATIPWMDPDTDVPVAHAGPDQRVMSGATVKLDGRGSMDSDGMISSYAWTRTGGTGGSVILSDASRKRPTFTADILAPGASDVTHVFSLVVTDDGNARSVADTMTVVVMSPFVTTVANAGPDLTVASGATVTLDGSGSAVDRRRTRSHAWTRTGGTGGTVTLDDASAEEPIFTADTLAAGADDVTYVFELTVTDSDGGTSVDTVTITATSNEAPVASAGEDQTVDSGARVRLRGDLSVDPDGDGTVTYAWTRTRWSRTRWARTSGNGDAVTLGDANALSNPREAQPTFMADVLKPGVADVIHVFSLTVTDSYGATDTDTVRITVTSPFENPVARAGEDQAVRIGDTVTLDGSRSSADRRATIVSHAWKRTGGTGDASIDLVGENMAQSSFMAVGPGPLSDESTVTHDFELTVTDSAGGISTDTVTVTIVITNFDHSLSPVADAGPDRTVGHGTSVMLDGSGSRGSRKATGHGHRDINFHAWKHIRTLGTPGLAPVATGETTITRSCPGTLSPNRKKTLFSCSQRPTFVADNLSSGVDSVTYVFELRVTDVWGLDATDRVMITVVRGFVSPEANAGPDQMAGSGMIVTLDGSGSMLDSRKTPHTYAWERISGTGSSSIALSNANVARPTFTADSLAEGAPDVIHVFRLTVTDSDSASGTDTVTIRVVSDFQELAKNADPVADAGEDQTVGFGMPVQLDGSDSMDSDGTIVSYSWKWLYGTGDNNPDDGDPHTPPVLSSATAQQPTFTADTTLPLKNRVTHTGEGSSGEAKDKNVDVIEVIRADEGTHVFELTVTDDKGATATDRVRITVKASVVAKTDLTAPTGRFAAEDGGPLPNFYGTSDPFTLALVFDEEVTIKSVASIVSRVSVETPEDIYFRQLPPEYIRESLNHLPVISDLKQDPTDRRRYKFTLDPKKARIWFELVLQAQNYQDLAGNRGAGDIRTGPILYADEEVINEAPVANAGENRTVISEAMVTLDGTGSSDTEGDIEFYKWERTGGTGGPVVLSDPSAAKPTFRADTLAAGTDNVTHEFLLTVTDESRHEIRVESGTTNIPAICRDGRLSEERCTLIHRKTDEATVTVTVDAPPVANAGLDQNVGTETLVTLDGRASRDSNTTLSYAWTGPMPLTDADTAMPTFMADILGTDAAEVTREFMLTVTDSQGQTATDTIEVTISSNTSPTADAGTDQEDIPSGREITLDGSASMDEEGTIDLEWERTGGTAGADVTLDDMTAEMPKFTVNLVAGAMDVEHVFTLTVTDNDGAIDTDMVRVTIVSAFAMPMAVASTTTPNIGSGGSVTLDGSSSTVDRRRTIKSWDWQRTRGTGIDTLKINGATTATPTFTVETRDDGAVDVTHVFELTLTDSADMKSTATVTVTVISAFADTTANAGENQTGIVSGTAVSLDGSNSMFDFRRGPVSYAWARTGGTANETVTLVNANQAVANFTDTVADGAQPVEHIFTLTVTDNTGVSVMDTVTVTVVTANQIPVASVTSVTVKSGEPVTLTGRGRDDDGTVEEWKWTRKGGSGDENVVLAGEDTAELTFTADRLVPGAPDATHVFEFMVTDDDNAESLPVEVTVTVESDIAVPVANAGADRTINSGMQVTLDGSDSSVDFRRTLLAYAWERTDGSEGANVTLDDPTAEMPTFTDSLNNGDRNVEHVFTLTVTDNAGMTATDRVTITIVSDFAMPVADAGENQTGIVSGTAVSLDGSNSMFDFRRGPVSYAWARTGGTANETVTLVNANQVVASFTDTVADGAQPVEHIFTLTVTDNTGVSVMDTVTVTVVTANQIPVASVTSVTVKSGEPVTLTGRGRDDDGTVEEWKWTRKGGSGDENVVLAGEDTAELTFTADRLVPGAPDATHVFEFMVTDDDNAESLPVEVTVTVESDIAVPVANAGADRTINSGMQVTLDGSGSSVDFRRTLLAYAWERTDGSEGADVTLDDPTAEMPTFTDSLNNGDRNVEHVFTLTVTDDAGMTATDTVTITVVSDFSMPVANAGEDLRVISGTVVRLDGSGSSPDFRKTIESWRWERTGGTGGASVILTGADSARPEFRAVQLEPGAGDVTHVFTLTVTDEDGRVATDTVTVTVFAPSVDILVSSSELTVQEGGSGVYRVRLGESPGQQVTVFAIPDQGKIVLNHTFLLFDDGNWNDWQEIRVSAVVDSDGLDGHAVIRHMFAGKNIVAAHAGEVRVRIRENDPVLPLIGDYLVNRATTFMGQQPGLIPFLRQNGTRANEQGGFSVAATEGRLSAEGGFVHNGVWGEITGARVNGVSGGTDFMLGSLGVHRRYSDNFLAGFLLQYDHANHGLAGQTGSIDGSGWMGGPYIVMRSAIQPLYLEGRLLYGQSGHEIRFMDPGAGIGMRTGLFDSRRWLAQLRVEGEIVLSANRDDSGDFRDNSDGSGGVNNSRGGSGNSGLRDLRLIPYADARWIEERATAFVTGSATGSRISVLGQKISIGEMEFGLDVEIPITVNRGALMANGGLGLVYSNLNSEYVGSDSRGHGRLEAGFVYDLDENTRIDLGGFYDGIGLSPYESYGLSINAELKF